MSPHPSSQGNEMAYAVHTATCTYLLDEDGICKWIVAQQGIVPQHVRQCIGAQFVACVDVTVEGGLVGQLRPGARALFVQNAGDRMIMMRTGPIQHVDDRRVAAFDENTPPPPAAALRAPAHGQYGKPPAPIPGIPRTLRVPPSFGVVEYHGEEQTITISRQTETLSLETDFADQDLPTRSR
jgi:hypothetical protein